MPGSSRFRKIGCDTARSEVEPPRRFPRQPHDLEVETVEDVVKILKAEFETDSRSRFTLQSQPPGKTHMSDVSKPVRLNKIAREFNLGHGDHRRFPRLQGNGGRCGSRTPSWSRSTMPWFARILPTMKAGQGEGQAEVQDPGGPEMEAWVDSQEGSTTEERKSSLSFSEPRARLRSPTGVEHEAARPNRLLLAEETPGRGGSSAEPAKEEKPKPEARSRWWAKVDLDAVARRRRPMPPPRRKSPLQPSRNCHPAAIG